MPNPYLRYSVYQYSFALAIDRCSEQAISLRMDPRHPAERGSDEWKP
jgi:hypothetical protein